MNIQYSMPPRQSGKAAEDVSALSVWCGGLLEKLKKVILSIEDGNILSVSAEKLTGGTMSLKDTTLKSDNIEIDSSSFTITNTDETGVKTLIRAAVTAGSTELLITDETGAKYIKLSGGKLEICADSITAEKLSADELSAETININGTLRAGTIHCNVLEAGTIIE